MHETFMQEAIAQAFQGVRDGYGGPFGCVIVKDNKIIGRGFNRVLSSQDPTAHAEIVAIREACQNQQHFWLQQSTLYTTCEPCPMCLGAIFWSRIETVYYAATRQDAAAIGFDDEFFLKQFSLPIEQRHIPMRSIMRAEALTIFAQWQTVAKRY
jgi:tRNA(Arg) A34 adenosine deaminase TadA